MSYSAEFNNVLTSLAKMNSYVGAAEASRNSESAAARGSWLVALASMLGKMADRLGDAIVKQAELIDNEMNRQAEVRNESKGKKSVEDSNLTQLNAELTAMSQQMKMLQESISTIIKSIGEGNSSIARKQ